MNDHTGGSKHAEDHLESPSLRQQVLRALTMAGTGRKRCLIYCHVSLPCTGGSPLSKAGVREHHQAKFLNLLSSLGGSHLVKFGQDWADHLKILLLQLVVAMPDWMTRLPFERPCERRSVPPPWAAWHPKSFIPGEPLSHSRRDQRIQSHLQDTVGWKKSCTTWDV